MVTGGVDGGRIRSFALGMEAPVGGRSRPPTALAHTPPCALDHTWGASRNSSTTSDWGLSK
jgi:hypothetical protein